MLKSILSLSFVFVLFTGCSEDTTKTLASVLDAQKVEVTAVDGYIRDAVLRDLNDQQATYRGEGVYIFKRAVAYPLTLSGGFLDATDAQFDVVLQLGIGNVISPLTTVLYKNPELGAYLAENITGINSVEELQTDYLNSNNKELAKLSQLMYVMLKDSNLTDSFAISLLDSNSTTIDEIFTLASNEINNSNLDLKAELNTFLNTVQTFDGNVSDLETDLEEVKNVLITEDSTAPDFNSSALISIYENNITVTTVLAQDTNLVTYSISGTTDNDLFEINAVSGVLTFINLPDYENPSDDGADNIYNLTITATDSLDNEASQALVITVNNLNDNAPVFDSNATASVNEDQTAAITLSASDTDNDTLTYSISGTDSASLDVNSSTGVVTFKTAPDFETKSTYTFTATVSDGTSSATQAVTISINNLNDNAPTITSSATASVNENQTAAITLTASDDDNDTLSYSISGTDAASFAVDSSTGVVSFVSAPDFESAKTSYAFTASVSDGSNSVTQAVTININNLNDNAPTVSDVNVSGDENGDIAITLLGSDADNDSLTYTIVSLPSAGSVSVTGNTATFSAPDVNATTTYTFTYKANDSVQDSSTATVTVSVNYVNTRPTANGISNVVVEKDTSHGITLDGNDADGDNLTYSITTGPSNGTLSITNNIATFTPNAGITGSDSFWYVVDDGILISVSALVTISVTDTIAPTVVSTSPTDTATDVDVNSTISITFDETVDTATFDINVSSVSGDASGGVSFDGAALTATFAPTGGLNYDETYTVSISSDDLAGNNLTQSFTFTTAKNLIFSLETSGIFSSRSGHQMVNFNNSLYVIAGLESNGTRTNDVWKRVSDTNWTQISWGGYFSARDAFQSVVFNDKIYLIGGYDGTYLNDVWSSSDGMAWTNDTNTSAFTGREGHQVVVFNNKMYLISGIYEDDIWSSGDGVTWSQEPANARFSARDYHQVVVYKGSMYVIGGTSAGVLTNDVWSSSDGINWTEKTPSAAFSPRYGHKVVVYNDKMYLIGGNDGVSKNDIWSSSDGINWVQDSIGAFEARYRHQVAVLDDKIYLTAGSGATYNSDVWSSNDIAAPSVASTIPSNNATGIALDTNVVFTLSEDINTSSLSVSGLVTGNTTISGDTLTFNPDDNLTLSTNYTATLSGTVSDALGNTRTISYDLNFTTGSAFELDTFTNLTYDGSNTDRGNGVATDSAGNIYVTGFISNGTDNDMAIWKYKSNGELDTTFGSNGVVKHYNAAGGNSHDYGNSITLDASGNIYVAGNSMNNSSNYDMVIWKYTSAGVLDTDNFRIYDGYVVYQNNLGNDFGNAITIDSSNTIYVAGSVYTQNWDLCATFTYNSDDMAIWKYDSIGNQIGTTITYDRDTWNYLDYDNEKATSIALDASGNIYVSGNYNGTYSGTGMRVWKYDDNGTLYDSKTVANSVANAVALDSANNVYITGSNTNNFGDMAIWKYDQNLNLDTNFTVTYDGGNGDQGTSLVIDDSDNIYVTGSTYDGADMRIWKYTNSGSLDTSFDGDGMAIDFGSDGVGGVGNSITLDSSGRIVVAGEHNNGTDNDMAIWRYNEPDTIIHNGTTYGTLTSPVSGRIWLDRNLGASQVCTAYNDTACYGDYYQWGRQKDGHQISTSTLSTTQASNINSAGASFIYDSSGSYNYDWAYLADTNGTQRTVNWSKTDGTSVCPVGYRVPTSAEVAAENITWYVNAFDNLKLPAASYRNTGGTLYQDLDGRIWTTTVDAGWPSRATSFNYNEWNGMQNMDYYAYRSNGYSIRCIKD